MAYVKSMGVNKTLVFLAKSKIKTLKLFRVAAHIFFVIHLYHLCPTVPSKCSKSKLNI